MSAYIVLMTAGLESMVATTYVADIDRSRAFYELLGFREHSTGRAPTAAWCVLHQGQHYVLLGSTRPPLKVPALPLHFYFYYDDVDAVTACLRAAGVTSVHMGHPPHALGGEVKLRDPDGNTILIGQRERSDSQTITPDDPGSPHFSLLREAAALIEAQGGVSLDCEVAQAGGARCSHKAEVKLADSGGHAVWACLNHADEILMVVHGAFIASQDQPGLDEYLASRR